MKVVLTLAMVQCGSGAVLAAVLVLPAQLLTGEGPQVPALAYGVASALGLGLGLFAGPVADRRGCGSLLRLAGSLLVAAAWLCLHGGGVATAALAVGAGVAVGLTFVPALSLASASGPEHSRSRRCALLVTGNAIGGLAGSVVAGFAVERAAPAATATMLVAGLLHLVGSRTVPAPEPSTPAHPSIQLQRAALPERLPLATALGAGGVTGTTALLVPAALNGGASMPVAAALPAMATAAGLLGRLVQTGWGDRLHPASAVRLGALVTGGGALVLALIATETATQLTTVGVAGTAQGAWVAALPSLVAGAVPASARGRAMGQVYAWAAVGSVSGPLMVGWLAQRVDTAPAFGLCALLCLTGALTTPREIRAATVPATAPTRRTT